MRRHQAIAISACLALLGGCQTMVQHNDVLIFGTTTNFGVDVSASGTTGSPTPNLTVGYKRTEAVWMPLIANAAEAGQVWKPNLCPANAANCVTFDQLKYLGHGENTAATAQGGGDAYSVLASFGAKGSATGSTAPTAGLGLAQFFATGIAAQRLASNAAVSQVLAIQDPTSATAGAKAAAVSSAVQSGDPKLVAAATAGGLLATQDQALADRASACLNKKGSDAFAALLTGAKAQSEVKSATTSAAMLNFIQRRADADDVEHATSTLCP
jgi:hypothetical protein